MDSDADGVSEFLLRVRELGDKRDREDEERTRKLEQEIIAGREARLARRDERARSLSPQKDSPIGTPTSGVRSFGQNPPASEFQGETHTLGISEDRVNDTMEQLTKKGLVGPTEGELEAKEQGEPRPAAPLSWQRRPKSNTVSSSNRPLPGRQPAGGEEEGGGGDVEKRRSEIALNLGSKDPSWFRQTGDRGATSAALRKSPDEVMDITGRMALPGMLPGPAIGKDVELPPEPVKPSHSSNLSDGALAASTIPASKYRGRSESLRSANRVTSSDSSESAPGPSLHARNPSLSSTSSLRLDPLGGRDSLSSSDGISRPIAMSPSQGRISPERRERTPSPTKGLGSFVQSAMLRREGSLNKRWSNSPQPGTLSRSGSNASTTRPTYPGPRGSVSSSLPREPSPALEDASGSRIKLEATEEGSQFDTGRRGSITESLSKSSTTGEGVFDSPPSSRPYGEHTPPSSPTKTFDQKRWSPTKSSWLESALKKGTESPQFTPPAMKPLVKPHEKPLSKSIEKRLPEVASAPIRPPTNPKPPSLSPKPSGSPSSIPSPQLDGLSDAGSSPPAAKSSTTEKPNAPKRSSFKTPIGARSSVFERQPPKPKEALNLRAGLKPRPTMESSDKGEELPFLNAMSRLRSVKTQNYAAPNELKERILAGKANLQTTGGPQRNKGPDPVKETLLSAKGSLKQSHSTGAIPPVVPAGPKPRLQELPKRASAPEKIEPEKKGSSLASRFNPDLANLLQRGPPGISASKGPDFGKNGDRARVEHKTEEGRECGGALTHMTKGRARGPKRRAPTTKGGGSDAPPIAPEIAPVTQDVLPPPTVKWIPSPKLPEPPAKPPLSNPPMKQPEFGLDLATADETPAVQKGEKPKPPTPAKSPLLKTASNTNLGEGTSADSSVPPPADRTSAPPQPVLARSSSRIFSRDAQPLPSLLVEEREEEEAIRNAAGWGRPVETPVRVKTPLRLPKRTDENLVNESPKPSPTILPKFEPEQAPLPASHNVSGASGSSRLLVEFFKGPPTKNLRIDLDVMGILSSNPVTTNEAVRTLKVEVSEITGYGKLRSIPQEQNNVFFEESMYVCLHNFETTSGSKGRELCFWSGDKVPEAAVEDAQLFVRKLARENGCKLIRLRQGRETSSFLEALGGVIITRRGSRLKLEEGHSFALCGRSCMGNIVFDEVTFKASSLCSGFPFIISLKGKIFLWKGNGSTPEELGVARLIAYDTPGGDVQEIEENKEPAGFFDMMEGGAEDRSRADYWRLKPSYKSYATRLFRLVEISPFCQSDLDPSEIFVADAFFELVLGPASQYKRAEFQLALQFAQEYAILAASVNDRPKIPASTIIVGGGAPREFKAVFRNWEDLPSQNSSLQTVDLGAAMEALGLVQ